MNKSRFFGLAIALLTPLLTQPARAEMLVLGTASTGETLTLDTDTVSRTDRGTGLFISATYYLNNERIDAEISCRQRYWVVEGDSTSTQYRPQSQATRNLLDLACSIRGINRQSEDTGYLLVYDPPSNVRDSPNGSVKCTIDTIRIIRVYSEPRNGWYSTNACPGSGSGWINQSQVRPLR